MNPKITSSTAEVVFRGSLLYKGHDLDTGQAWTRDNVLHGEGQLQKLMFHREVVTWPDVLDVECRSRCR